MGLRRFWIQLTYAFLVFNAVAEEGMWPFHAVPMDSLWLKYQFKPTQEWLDHIRFSCVDFLGGSGSFVSPDGLVLTNHHVAISMLQKMSREDLDYISQGFYAEYPEMEIPCPDLEIRILVDMKNVTSAIHHAGNDSMNDVEALNAVQACISRIETEARQKTGLLSKVVSFYQGGEYWLYQYKEYDDIRLVMAPEQQIAFFGGDDDNFTFPRYDLDIAFFRVYENGKPLKSAHYLKWNRYGANAGELVLASGYSGKTTRLFTNDQFMYLRDTYIPMILDYYRNRISGMEAYSKLGTEQTRIASVHLFMLKNSEKSYIGMLKSLSLSETAERIRRKDSRLRLKIESDSLLKKLYGDALDTLSGVTAYQKLHAKSLFYRRVIGSRLADWAIKIVIYHEEKLKPDTVRIKGYHDSEIEELRRGILSKAPISKDFEIYSFTDGLRLCLEELGPDDPYIVAALSGKSSETMVTQLIEGTLLDQIDIRQKMLDEEPLSSASLSDPLIQWAKQVAPVLRADMDFKKIVIDSKFNRASEKLAKARFIIDGKNAYPDANSTLRLSYGTLKSYGMNGTKAPVFTTLYGLYDRCLGFYGKGDYALPERFWKKQKKLNLSTRVNFVSTCDIVGGNSGSPVINTKGELVGLVFDGNIESLSGGYYYNISSNRAVSVHTAFIIEALRKLYNAGRLADEIEGK